jgi:hypothetical protein
MGDQPFVRPVPAQRVAQTKNTCTQSSMPQVRFEPTIPAFERAKTVHALDRSVTFLNPCSVCIFYLYYPVIYIF